MKWRRQWHPTPVLLPGKSHGWRSLVGCNPWGCKESDTTEWLHFHFSLSCIREGNGNPLQRSCLENPRDRGAWWAAIYGVAQSWTRLKWLSRVMKIFFVQFFCVFLSPFLISFASVGSIPFVSLILPMSVVPAAKSNLEDRVLGEVKRNHFIALLGKEGHSGLVP